MSHKSHRTRSVTSVSSKTTSITSAVAIARANAEAAKMRASFADQEMQLKLEKARVDAALESLAAKREAAAALAEAESLEAAQSPKLHSQSSMSSLEFPLQDSPQRTSQYVNEFPDPNYNPEPVPKQEYDVSSEVSESHHEAQLQDRNKLENVTQNNSANDYLAPHQVTNVDHPADTPYVRQKQYDTGWRHPEDTNRYERTSHHYQGDPSPVYSADNRFTTEFARFFTRRELVAKGLMKFNDQAEGYRAWKASFQNVIRDLGLQHREEIDLLVKYLGEESVKHAVRIRDININRPETGLREIWKRLDECYGSAEVIERALFKRIDDFPKISNKGLQKLRELSDLLKEVQVAKYEDDLQGLAFLDTARGVNPIVQKLPYNLQERWLTHGSTYKYKHSVPFPPFSVVVDFIHQQVRIRNDPSFDFAMPYATPSPPANPRRTSVAVHKTYVSSPGSNYRSAGCSQSETKVQDPDKQCPLHQKPHPLLKCRAFRGKSMPDRRSFLKENGICYKCCSSTTHYYYYSYLLL
ncbi:uncharacterized protein LOC143783349 [Ranitomeya variabilis]|uniref:uncharacterized protein LOC143783349 n=1 Tax=Ranitomeya variabilis TaxID=490064 RepID=UPI004056EE29